MIKIKKTNSGYSLIETIFYIALFAMLSIVVINSIITMTKSFKEVSIYRENTQGGNTIIERISREIRQAYDVNTIDAQGDLKLYSKDDAGTEKTIEFVKTNSNIRILENDSYVGDLNSSNIEVVSLNFSQINTAKSKAVKVSLTINSNHDIQNRNYDFYDTIVLRGSY